MDLKKMAADLRANYSLYANAHLEILEAHETFKFACRWDRKPKPP